MALRTVGVRLAAEVSGYVNNLRTAARSTRDFTGELDRAAQAGKLDAVADKAAAMGLGLVGAFAVAVGAAAKFDKQMSEVGAVSNATAGDLERLRAAALRAGKDTAFSATEAAQAEAELAKAGIGTADILGGALTGSLNLAAAGSLDLAEAADVGAKTMNIFGLEGQDMGHIADVLAAAANKSATDVHEMGEALKMSGLAANAAGMGLEETAGTLAAFADNALNGSDAGTSLKTAIMMLQVPTAKSAKLMDELGISAYDANGQFIGTAKLAGQLQSALGGLTQEQRNAALATIFGADGMRAANVLYATGEQGIRDYIAAVDDQGAAAETAAKKTDNLMGDVERLTGSLETLAIESGSGANGGLRTLTQGANALVDQFASLPPAIGSTVTVLAGVGGAALLAGAGWVKMRHSTAAALTELRNTGPVGARAATGLQTTAKWAGRAAVAFIALEVASAILSAAQEDLNIQIDALGEGLASWGKGGDLAGEAARVLGTDMKDLNAGFKFLADTDNSRRGFVRWGQDVLETVVPGLDGTNTSLTRTRERVQAFDQALATMVQGGKATDAAATFERFAATQLAAGVSIDEVKAKFPAYAAALELATGATGGAAGAIGGMGGEASDAAADVQKLKDAFDRLFGIQMGIDQATIAYRRGIIDLNKELTTGARTIALNSTEGLKNRDAVLDQIGSIKDLRQARIDNNMSIEDADALYVSDIKGLQASMRAAGFTEAQILTLTEAYLGIPGEAKTPVSAPGATAAKKQADDFNFAIKNIPPSKTVPFYASTGEARAAVNALKAKISELRDKHIYISGTVYWTSKGDMKVPGGTQLKNRWGGLYEHAAEGKLREAQVASPMGPARYAWAEPATGGEAFIPKFGDRERSLGILEKAAGWYGKTLASPPMYTTMGGGAASPAAWGGRGGNTYQISVNVAPGASPAEVGRVTVEAIKAYEHRSGKGWRSP